jgi:hypothetical protein
VITQDIMLLKLCPVTGILGSALIWIFAWLRTAWTRRKFQPCWCRILFRIGFPSVIAGVVDCQGMASDHAWIQGILFKEQRELAPVVASKNIIIPDCSKCIQRGFDLGGFFTSQDGKQRSLGVKFTTRGNHCGCCRRIWNRVLFGDCLRFLCPSRKALNVKCWGSACVLIQDVKYCRVVFVGPYRLNIRFRQPCPFIENAVCLHFPKLLGAGFHLPISQIHVPQKKGQRDDFNSKSVRLYGWEPLRFGLAGAFYGGIGIRFGAGPWFHYVFFFAGFILIAIGWHIFDRL